MRGDRCTDGGGKLIVLERSFNKFQHSFIARSKPIIVTCVPRKVKRLLITFPLTQDPQKAAPTPC
jgi:hypothetical protein